MLTDVVEIHFLELPKFRNKKNKDYRENDIERWLIFLEKDISEERAKLQIAKNLLDILDDETIAVKTGLDIKEVKALR